MNNNEFPTTSLKEFMEQAMITATGSQPGTVDTEMPIVEFQYDPVAIQFVAELAKRHTNPPMGEAAKQAMLVALDQVISELDTSSPDFPTQLAGVLCSKQKIRISDVYAKKYTGGKKIANPVLGEADVAWLRETLERILGREVAPSWELIEPGYKDNKDEEAADDWDEEDEIGEAEWDEEDDLGEDDEDEDYVP